MDGRGGRSGSAEWLSAYARQGCHRPYERWLALFLKYLQFIAPYQSRTANQPMTASEMAGIPDNGANAVATSEALPAPEHIKAEDTQQAAIDEYMRTVVGWKRPMAK